MIGLNCLIDSIAANEHLCGNCTGIFKDQQTSLFSFSFKANLQIFEKPQFSRLLNKSPARMLDCQLEQICEFIASPLDSVMNGTRERLKSTIGNLRLRRVALQNNIKSIKCRSWSNC